MANETRESPDLEAIRVKHLKWRESNESMCLHTDPHDCEKELVADMNALLAEVERLRSMMLLVPPIVVTDAVQIGMAEDILALQATVASPGSTTASQRKTSTL